MKIDWKSLVRSVAPALGTALGGPAGRLAVAALAKSLLGKENASVEEVEQAVLNATPEQLLAIKKVDNDFAVQMKQLGIDLEKSDAGDRASAREMAAKLGNVWPQIIISTVYNVGYFYVLYTFITGIHAGSLDDWQKGMVGTLLGVLTAAIPQINNFWFGSSHGSQKKDVLSSIGE